MTFDQWSDGGDIQRINVVDKECAVGIAHIHRARQLQIGRIDRANLEVDAARIHSLGQWNLFPFQQRRSHVDRDHVIFICASRDKNACISFDANFRAVALFHHQPADAAGDVAAGRHFAAVIVPDPHEDVGAHGMFQRDDLISASRIGDALDRCCVQVHALAAPIENGKAIPASVHLIKLHNAQHIIRLWVECQLSSLKNRARVCGQDPRRVF